MNKRLALLPAAVLTVAGCVDSGDGSGSTEEREGVTVRSATSNAFTHPLPGLTAEQVERFDLGDADFEAQFVAAGNDTNPGLGPLFNANSCEACHPGDGRAAPPDHPDAPSPYSLGKGDTLFLRISTGNSAADGPEPVSGMGTQLQHRATGSYQPEATVDVTWESKTVTYGDGTTEELRWPEFTIREPVDPDTPDPSTIQVSPRLAPPVFGRGLIEAIPATTLHDLADAEDRDGDGISGRVNEVRNLATGEMEVGRFGLKANSATLLGQNAGAYQQDMGVTNHLLREDASSGQVQDDGRADDPELGADYPSGTPNEAEAKRILEDVTFYVQTLAVPARRNADDPQVLRGEELFNSAGCASCHVPTLETGDHPDGIAQLEDRTIHPYSDFLLHDMGEGLADSRGDWKATGSEWRTPPLWGIGLTQTVNGHQRYLHDGRADGLAEAVLWHGGEAEDARNAFKNMPESDREDLLAFLRSL
mgnify:CR=1 FL=1